jgi:protein-S-isoprenylcysteine O-methyltransferase Ste14
MSSAAACELQFNAGGYMAGAAGATVAVSTVQSRKLADWVGFLVYLGLAIWLCATSISLGLLMLPIFAYELLMSASFLVRRPLRAQLPGWKPQFAGYVGSFLPLIFLQAAARWFPTWLNQSQPHFLQVTGQWLWFVGLLLGVATLVFLRKSFSLVPQARVLITAGPYQFARHPIYLAYMLEYFGIWMARGATLPYSLMIVAWLTITYWRTRLEEKVLTQTFPEYEGYSRSVGRFFPRFNR